MAIADITRPISADEMDAMSDTQYTALADECYGGGHPTGACPLCARQDADDPTIWDAASDREDYLDGMWDRVGFTYSPGGTIASKSAAIITAHKMVKSFVDTFAMDQRYAVTFDDSVEWAGTDYAGKKIAISVAPCLDPTIDSRTAGLVLTALAVHESSHVRYGRSMSAAARRAFPADPRVHAISNLLEDNRIEKRFVEDYPGYGHVFAPAIQYTADALLRAAGEDKHVATDDLELLTGAVRYPMSYDWSDPDHAAEKAWYEAWLARWIDVANAPKIHVQAVREVIDHMDARAAQSMAQQTLNQQSGQGQSGQSSQASQASGDPGGTGTPGVAPSAPQTAQDASDDAEPSDGPEDDIASALREFFREFFQEEIKRALSGQPASRPSTPPSTPTTWDKIAAQCPTENINEAAAANGVSVHQIAKGYEAQQIVNVAETIHQVDETEHPNWQVEVRPAGSIGRKHFTMSKIEPSAAVSSAVRNAFMRSRTGHTGIERGMARGRCDNRSLARIAHNDYRLFHRRSAPDPGKYLIWMLIDRSGSMSGQPTYEVASAAMSIAAASKYVGSLRMAVMGWTSGQHVPTGLYEAWRSGQSIDKITDLMRIPESGTPDAVALAYAARAITDAAMPDEQPVILMMSDGWGMADLPEVVDAARKRGVRVISVAIGAQVDAARQEAIYGTGNYITWKGTITRTALPLARLLGRVVAS